MTQPSFVLTEEPWLPCESLEGKPREVSLRDSLVDAHQLRALTDPSPLVTVALHRLLLAIVHRCFGPANLPAWKKLYDAGRFDPTAIDHYLTTWRHRFDLFHPERPFYQAAGIPDADDGVSILSAERWEWGATDLFEHRPPSWDDRVTPAKAARGLVTYHAYAPGGLVKKPGEPTSASDGPLQRGIVALVRGATLFETLMLNLLVYSDESPIPADGDAPSWEVGPLPSVLTDEKEPRRMPHGWLDLLTWQSRRMLLKAHDGAVTGLIRRVGQGLHLNAPQDPMMTWRQIKERGMDSLGFEGSRAFWRDSHALFHASDTRTVVRPKALEQLADPDVRGHIGEERQFLLELYGLAGYQARIDFDRVESLPVSPKLLANADAGTAVRNVLTVAEDVASEVHSAAFLLARVALSPGDRDPDPKDVRQLSESGGAARRYWAALQHPFEHFIEHVSSDEDAAVMTFVTAVRRSALDALTRASRGLGSTSRALKAGCKADEKLRIGLFKAIPEQYRPMPKEATP